MFILEDLHWVDPTTLDLLNLLIEQIPATSVLLLFTYRPEFQPPWTSRSYLMTLTLNRLTPSQVEDMVAQITFGKGLPSAVLHTLVEKSDGVPLFVEELTKAMLDSGQLHDINGQYELSASSAMLSIPATLQDSLMARLNQMNTAKHVLQLGALLGREFAYELIHAISSLDEATLQNGLAQLVEAELLYQRGQLPQSTYIFKHALIQEAAYDLLLRSQRRQYHQRIV
ncbi:hypothetical protein C2W62_39815, partial [Candidatus Entotheonella serta]